MDEEYWVGRYYSLRPTDEGHQEYHIYSFPGGAVRDSISYGGGAGPHSKERRQEFCRIAYEKAWARFIELQREAWDNHDQQLKLSY